MQRHNIEGLSAAEIVAAKIGDLICFDCPDGYIRGKLVEKINTGPDGIIGYDIKLENRTRGGNVQKWTGHYNHVQQKGFLIYTLEIAEAKAAEVS